MKYTFEFNSAGYPICRVSEPHDLFGKLLSFEIFPTRIRQIKESIERAKHLSKGEVAIQRDDGILTIHQQGKVGLKIFDYGKEQLFSDETNLNEFENLFSDWCVFLEDKWTGYGK